MSEPIFGVDLAIEIYGAMGGQLQAGTLSRQTGETVDDYGTPTPTFATEPVEGIVSRWSVAVMTQRGYAVETMKVMLLAKNASGDITEPRDGMRVTLGGVTMQVFDVTYGAGRATFTMAGVPV